MKPESIEYIVSFSKDHESGAPVTTALYTLEVAMNEEDPDATDEAHRERFANEFQKALDAGFFTALRYDAMTFEVTKREVLHTEPVHNEEVV